MGLFSDISANLQKGRVKNVENLVKEAVSAGHSAGEILESGLLDGMNVVGVKFKNNEIFVPEVLIAARAMTAGLTILKPLLVKDGVKSGGRVVIGTVKGDQHDIGKNLVKMMMEGKGLEVVDLGTNVAPEKFVETALREHCRICACSALLTTTMGVMKDVVTLFEKSGHRSEVRIMVGGAPVTQEFCDKIGADAYTPDAASASEVAAAFCKEAAAGDA